MTHGTKPQMILATEIALILPMTKEMWKKWDRRQVRGDEGKLLPGGKKGHGKRQGVVGGGRRCFGGGGTERAREVKEDVQTL